MTPLSKKLHIKEGQKVLIKNVPDELAELIAEIPGQARTNDFENIHAAEVGLLFVENQAELKELLQMFLEGLRSSYTLWLAYPKKSGSVKTDISRDTGWDFAKSHGLEPVSIISLSDNWSALRMRPTHEIQTTIAERNARQLTPPAELIVPAELIDALDQFPDLRIAFDTLPYSHKKEHIQAIESAKKEETRLKRVEKSLDILRERAEAIPKNLPANE